jgi:5-methyltetrahydropteroyltriglutamate--homocysteine methyltransferase
MKTTIVGYPRIGQNRELKRAEEAYFKGQLSKDKLAAEAARLRAENRTVQLECGLDLVPVGDFSLYDNVLDAAVMLGAVPERYQKLGLDALDTYFAMAHGYQGTHGDVHALAMKKWFNTNYHYLVPELEESMELHLVPDILFGQIGEARAAGLAAEQLKISVTGPFTFLKLAQLPEGADENVWAKKIASVYAKLLALVPEGAWLELDEPWLVRDISKEDEMLFVRIARTLLNQKHSCKILLQTYFGDIRDVYGTVTKLGFDGIGLDFVEGTKTDELVSSGFPKDTVLFAGIVNGKNIWRTNYRQALSHLKSLAPDSKVVLSTSCSLLHVPYTTSAETQLEPDRLKHLAFAEEKLAELNELHVILDRAAGNGTSVKGLLSSPASDPALATNDALFHEGHAAPNKAVRERLATLTEESFHRAPAFAEREKIQHRELGLPLLPTTTIGSFPQTSDVRASRRAKRKGEISEEQYDEFIKGKIADCIKLQEELSLDVLVHGEYERNDMVEYFGDNLEGFLFTNNGWVQSYGTRCVKPPIIWGDIWRSHPITVGWSTYAQSLTDKPVKGMLTGPVTILNWSFSREDIPRRESALQIALAIRDEVLDLERAGIRIIQIDEAALREKLPLRRSDWHREYLDWAIPAFRLVHSGVKPETQIHTHMCYSEFSDIIHEIDEMDADVITFEASRSNLSILKSLTEAGFRTEVGPGVYDIHSPRVPSKEEIVDALHRMLKHIPKEKLWVNPDCGLKTRGTKETVASLRNLVAAAHKVRAELS